MNAPTVLHFIETDIPGGAESMLLDLCQAQATMGLHPMVAHFDHPYFTQRCQELGIDSFTLPGRRKFKSMASLPAFAMEFAKRMRQGNVKLLHSHLFGPIVGGSVSAFLARIPHVGTLHDIHMVEEVPSRIAQLQVATLLGTRLVAVSEQMREFYRQRMKWHKDRIGCIYNGIKSTSGVIPATRESLEIPNDDIVAILVGRLVPLKRVQDSLHALKDALKQCSITLVVAGTGPELAGLQTLAAQLKIGDKVKFLGERRDIPALLAMADLFVQCSETEGLSMSIIEALHAGLPCIVTRVGGNPELVEHQANGLLCEVGDRTMLTTAIARLAQNQEIRQTMGGKSKAIALKNFTSQGCTKKYLDFYHALGVKPANQN